MTTELDIINHMLNVIGETPVSDPNSTYPSVASARVEMDRVNKELQSRGWWFNTEYDLTITPNNDGHILVPNGTLEIDPINSQSNLVWRGSRLYDSLNHTYVINEDVIVDAVLQLDIADLPEVAAMFILHKAAYDFYVNDDGDETKSNRLEKEVNRTWARLQQAELKNADVNARNRPIVARLRGRMQQAYSASNPNYPGGR